MLKILNELALFFDDVYREVSVRVYAREVKISPPTASKLLKEYEKEELLVSNKKGIYIYFRANREGYIFRQLAKLYWFSLLYPLTKKIHEDIAYKRIILFGSLIKAENTLSSDVDLYLETQERKIDVLNIQKALKKDIQLHFVNSIKNKYLKKNIEDGIIIR